MTLLLLWFVCAFVGSAIASSRGRDVVLWFLLCLFLGPLGVFLVFALPADAVRLEARALICRDRPSLPWLRRNCPDSHEDVPALRGTP